MGRRDRFLGDSFSESGAKVNYVVFRARVPHACAFLCIACVSVLAATPLLVGAWGYGRAKRCRMCGALAFLRCVLVHCIIWLRVGSWD